MKPSPYEAPARRRESALRAETTSEDLKDDDLDAALDAIAQHGYCIVGVKEVDDDAARQQAKSRALWGMRGSGNSDH